MKRIKWLICLMTVLTLNTSFVKAEVIDDTNHTHTYGEVKKIIDGDLEKEIQECTSCDYVNVLSEKEHTHVYSEWEITKEATEDEAGTKTRKCLVEGCNAVENMSYVKIRDMRMTYVFVTVGVLMVVIITVITMTNKKKHNKN